MVGILKAALRCNRLAAPRSIEQPTSKQHDADTQHYAATQRGAALYTRQPRSSPVTQQRYAGLSRRHSVTQKRYASYDHAHLSAKKNYKKKFDLYAGHPASIFFYLRNIR
tara:strand:- start:646 stop:975 length:330 start_codon:yes stop_codon:yes gene_type:complete